MQLLVPSQLAVAVQRQQEVGHSSAPEDRASEERFWHFSLSSAAHLSMKVSGGNRAGVCFPSGIISSWPLLMVPRSPALCQGHFPAMGTWEAQSDLSSFVTYQVLFAAEVLAAIPFLQGTIEILWRKSTQNRLRVLGQTGSRNLG